jgi:5-methylcytosine-specific restriction endonuclease McrA
VRLTKRQREDLRAMFDGRCAYCGCELGQRWHADHIEPVVRKLQSVYSEDRRSYRLRSTSESWNPEHDRIENLMPACPPCNNHKHAHNLESWRRELGRAREILRKNYSTYRIAVRFGFVSEADEAPVVFHFEKVLAQRAALEHSNA